MSAIVTIGFVAVILVIACAIGQLWAPALLALGFGAWGALLLTSGMRGIVPLMGLAFVAAGIAELVAAGVMYGERDPMRQQRWRVGSALLGLLGSVGAIASLLYITAAIMSALFI